LIEDDLIWKVNTCYLHCLWNSKRNLCSL